MRAHEMEAAPGVHPAKARRITANIAKLPGLPDADVCVAR